MATGGDLTFKDHDIEDLAQVIVSKHMATIAIKYLGLSYETVENLKLIRQGDVRRLQQRLVDSVAEQKSRDKPKPGEYFTLLKLVRV